MATVLAAKRPKIDTSSKVCKCYTALPDRNVGSCVTCGRWLSQRAAANQS